MTVELKVPEIGESISEAEILTWLKHPGDRVEKDESIAELETDKASLELPCPVSGVVTELLKEEGDTVAVGDVIAYLDESGDGAAEAAPSGAKEKRPKEKESEVESEAVPAGAKKEESERPAEEEIQARPRSAPESPDRRTFTLSEQEVQVPAHREPEEEAPAAPQPTQAAVAEQESVPASEAAAKASPDERSSAATEQIRRKVTPAAMRALSKYHVEPGSVEPTGAGGRMLEKDVLRYVEEHEAGPQPKAEVGEGQKPETKKKSPEQKPAERKAEKTSGTSPSKEAENGRKRLAREEPVPEGEPLEQVVPMSRIRRSIAERLVQARQQQALLTTVNEIDMSTVIQLRSQYQESFQQQYGVKLGFMSLFVKATIDALERFPQLNAEIRGQEIVYRRYYDIGIAVASDRGLVVPVLRRAEQMNMAEIEQAIDDFAERAQAGQLAPDELQGGTFTITNGGVYGSLLSTPIVNPPQTGILGLHAIEDRPVARQGQVEIRPMMYVALTYDHRLVDGREAVLFLRRIKEIAEQPARLVMEV